MDFRPLGSQKINKEKHIGGFFLFTLYAVCCRPYYSGWVMAKMSPWRHKINRHILLVQQVSFNHSQIYQT